MLLHVDAQPCHARKIAHLITQPNGFCAGTKVCLQRTALEDCKRCACRKRLWPKVGGRAEEADSSSEMVRFLSLEAPRHKSPQIHSGILTQWETDACMKRSHESQAQLKNCTLHTHTKDSVLVVANHIVPKKCPHDLVLLLIILSLYFIMRKLS